MREEEGSRLSRRGFMQTVAGGFIGTSLVGVAELPRGGRFPQSEEEEGGGKLADEVEANFSQRGFGCAESIFRAVVTEHGESEKLVRLATPFNGGMGQGDLCGFITGGVLALGLLFGRTKGEERVKRGKCRSMTSQYYNWWKDNFPLHCSDIRKFGGKELCEEVGRKAASCLEGLIEKELKGNFSTEKPPLCLGRDILEAIS